MNNEQEGTIGALAARRNGDSYTVTLDGAAWTNLLTLLGYARACASLEQERHMERGADEMLAALRRADLEQGEGTPATQERRCTRCGKRERECLALGMLRAIATNGQCRVCNGQVGLGVEYEGLHIDLQGNKAARPYPLKSAPILPKNAQRAG